MGSKHCLPQAGHVRVHTSSYTSDVKNQGLPGHICLCLTED